MTDLRGAIALALLAGALPAVPSTSVAADAAPLMKESDRRTVAPDETVRYRMELMDGGKLVHAREMLRMSRVFPERRSTVVRFVSPLAVRGVSILIEDAGGAVNDIWTYTPSTKSLRRVAGSQKQNWFMGTEYTFEDFEDYKLGSYAFVEEAPASPCLSWPKCRVVDARPAAAEEVKASGYSRKRYYLEAESLFPVAIDYFDRDGALVKKLVVEGLRRSGEYTRPTAQTLTNLANGRATRLVVTDQRLATGLDASIFTQRHLRSEGE